MDRYRGYRAAPLVAGPFPLASAALASVVGLLVLDMWAAAIFIVAVYMFLARRAGQSSAVRICLTTAGLDALVVGGALVRGELLALVLSAALVVMAAGMGAYLWLRYPLQPLSDSPADGPPRR